MFPSPKFIYESISMSINDSYYFKINNSCQLIKFISTGFTKNYSIPFKLYKAFINIEYGPILTNLMIIFMLYFRQQLIIN